MPQDARTTRALNRARALFSAFQTISETMPIQIANTFILVALYEGRSMRDYKELAGVQQSTMSRHLLDLGERNRKKEPGFGLLEQRSDQQDLRRNIYRLTRKGENLLNNIVSVMEK
jgi:DNA-binding MarR family transcriptional regulator